MDEASRRAQLERNWEQVATGQQAAHDIYHDDAVLEFPQSGERFVGLENFREWRERYPVDVEFRVRRMRGRGDLWVSEVSVSYGEGGRGSSV
jgi:SnoaL-like domain